ncbi:MAG: YceI family protein [Chloroflexi bacterium]|nr:YceI family protein [Chloroflexota bacterium]
MRQTMLLPAFALTLSFVLGCTQEQSSTPVAAPTVRPAELTRAVAPPAPAAPPVAAAAAPSPVVAPSPEAARPVVSAPSPSSIAAGAGSGGTRYEIVSDRSEVRYRAREQFVGVDRESDAIGKTKAMTGSVTTIGPDQLRGIVDRMTIDLTRLQSDQANRDRFISTNTLNTARYPTVEFRSTDQAGPASYTPGQDVTFQLPGLLRVRDVEKPVTWNVTARLEGDSLIGTADMVLSFDQFGLEKPRVARILSIRDDVRLEADIVAVRVAGGSGAAQ